MLLKGAVNDSAILISIPVCSLQRQHRVHHLEWEYQKHTELHQKSEKKKTK